MRREPPVFFSVRAFPALSFLALAHEQPVSSFHVLAALSVSRRSCFRPHFLHFTQPPRIKVDYTAALTNEQFVSVARADPAASALPRHAAAIAVQKGLAVEAWLRLKDLCAAANRTEGGEMWVRLIQFFTGVRVHWNDSVRIYLDRLVEQ